MTWRALFLLAASAVLAFGDAGVLVPEGRQQPDPSIFSLEEMHVDVVIDSGVARVRLQQIYASHSTEFQEGNYVFVLPAGATVSDFAVWDGAVRIPGVILERRRAEELYDRARAQVIDPGLLEAGEDESEGARNPSYFSAHILPIPTSGTKRVEIEYHEPVRVENMQVQFALPLRPDAYQAQRAGRFSFSLDLQSEYPLQTFDIVGSAYPVRIAERTADHVRATWDAANVDFTEDLAFRYRVAAPAAGDALRVLTHRDAGEPGFVQASVLIPPHAAAEAGSAPARTIVALFDSSLSMQWEKLDRSFRALESLLNSLRPVDQFNVVLFNTGARVYAPQPAPASRENVAAALGFIRESPIQGGTNLRAALEAAFGQIAGAQGPMQRYFVLFTDGGSTEGTVRNSSFSNWYGGAWRQLPAAGRPHTFVFAVGDDANVSLLRTLGRNDGLFEWVRSTEPIDFKLQTFLSRIGQAPVEDLRLSVLPGGLVNLLYPLQDTTFAGSVASWIGQYRQASQQATFSVQGLDNGQQVAFNATAPLPAVNADHATLARTWAQARVDALLDQIDAQGETREAIDEIIRLSRKYKFVTPYTSFLAAPRALLRPRVIRPGDPVLRVHTDPSIVSVVALFPFGLVKPLKRVNGEAGDDIWQTRFLAPVDMDDGSHQVRLILRDKAGHVYREAKSFAIVSKPPLVRVRVDKARYRAGEQIEIRAQAGRLARTIVARLPGAIPASLRWNADAKANTGTVIVPRGLPAGFYSLQVTAEDIAHNIGTGEARIEIW